MRTIDEVLKVWEIERKITEENAEEFIQADNEILQVELYSHNERYPFTIRQYYNFDTDQYTIVYWYYPEGEPAYSGNTKPHILCRLEYVDRFEYILKLINKIFMIATEQFA